MGLGRSKSKANSILKFINNLLIIVAMSLSLQAEETNTFINQESDVYTSYEGQSEFGGAPEVNYSVVNTHSGNLTRMEVDLVLKGPLLVEITRWYNSSVDREQTLANPGTHGMGGWNNHQGFIRYNTMNSILCSKPDYCFSSDAVNTQITDNPPGIAPPVLEWVRQDGTIRNFYYDLSKSGDVPYDVVYTIDSGNSVLVYRPGIYHYESQEGDLLKLTYDSETKMSMQVTTTVGEILTFTFQIGAVGVSLEKPETSPQFWETDLTSIEAYHYYPIYREFQLTERKDLFGNKVVISHSTVAKGTWEEIDDEGLIVTNYIQDSRINTITDSYKRELVHEYYDGESKRLKRIYLKDATEPLEVHYTYDMKNTQKLVENGATKPTSEGGGYYVLTGVVRPGLYSDWSYEYWESSNGGEVTNYYGTHMLKKVLDLKYGLNETYYYGVESLFGGIRKQDQSVCYNQRQVVSKVVRDSYLDEPLEKTYSYGGDGITTVVYGDGNIRDEYYYNLTKAGSNWQAGLLNRIIRYDYGIEEETGYTYFNKGEILHGVTVFGLRPDPRLGTTCSYEDRDTT